MSSTTLAPSPAKRADEVYKVLETRLPHFLEVAPPALGEGGVKRLIRQACIAVAKSDKLAACYPGSICLSVLQAVELGVDLASARPIAWLVPYKGECKLMLGYVGLADIAYREGAVKLIQARAVFEADEFDIDYGNPAKPVTHKPAFSVDGNVGRLIGTYALAQIPAAEWPAFEWMDIREIEKTRLSSKQPEGDAWTNWYEEMAKKCPVRRMCKLLPTCPPRLNRALEIDRESDGLAEVEAEAGPAKPTNTDKLGEKLGVKPKGSPRVDPSDAQPPAGGRYGADITEDDITY